MCDHKSSNATPKGEVDMCFMWTFAFCTYNGSFLGFCSYITILMTEIEKF